MRLALLLWLTHFLVGMGLGFKAGAPQAAYVAHLGLQFLIISVACFLLAVVRMASSGIYWILGVQALAGATALYCNGNIQGAQVPAPWMVMNLLSAMLLTIAIAACVSAIARVCSTATSASDCFAASAVAALAAVPTSTPAA